jgi:hypothetical protein
MAKWRFVVTRRSRPRLNLPAAFAGAALHPPVVPARAVPDLQDGPEESRIARVTVLALAAWRKVDGS